MKAHGLAASESPADGENRIRNSPSMHWFAASAILLILVFSIYLPLLTGPAEFNGDDTGYVHQLEHTIGKLYTPLTNLTFILEKQVWGSNPKGYRLTNIVLMFVLALAAWKLALRFQPGNEAGRQNHNNSLFLLAIVCACVTHPLNVESVASISSRKELLYALFSVLALHAYSARLFGKYSLALTCAYVAMAQLSKGSAFILPLVFAAYEFIYRQQIEHKSIRYGHLAAISAASWPIFGYQFYIAMQHVADASQVGQDFSIWISTIVRTFYTFASHLLMPTNLSFEYEIARPTKLITNHEWLPTLICLVTLAYLWRRRLYQALFGALAALIVLIPYLNIMPLRHGFPVYIVHYDHYFLLTLAILPILLASIFLSNRLQKLRMAILLAMAGLTAYFTYQSHQMTYVWNTRETLYSHITQSAPNIPRGFIYLAQARMEHKQYQSAIQPLLTALKLGPDDKYALYLLANAYAFTHRYHEAEKYFSRAYLFDRTNISLLQNYASTLIQLKKYSLAREILNDLLEQSPGNASALYNLRLLNNLGQ
jgi:tetratricopeptide (TPR) repeat protein